MTKTPEPYDKLSEREKAWIDAQKANPVPTLDKPAMHKFLKDRGFQATPFAIRMAIIDKELPSKLVGTKRMVSEFDLLV